MDLRNDAVGKFYGGGAPEDNWVGHLTGSVATHYGKFEAWLKQHGTKVRSDPPHRIAPV